MRILLFVCTVWAALLAPRAEAREHHALALGSTLIMQNIGRTSGSPSGSSTLIGKVTPTLTAQAFVGGGEFFLIPAVSFAVIGTSGADSTVTDRILVVDAVLGMRMNELFDLHAGVGNLFHFVEGAGGTVVLNNGNSVTAFAGPGGSSTSRLFHLRAGLGVSLFSSSRIDLDTIVTGALSGDRRAINLSLGYTVGLL